MTLPLSPPALVLAAALGVASLPTAAADDRWTGTLSAGFETRHVYRGVDSGLDGAIVWQAGTVGTGGLTLGYWYGTGPNTAYEEFDLFGSYVHPLGDWELVPGFLWYHFPDKIAEDSTDLTLTLRRPIEFAGERVLAPFAYLSYNLDVEGLYGAIGLDYRQPLGRGWRLDAQVLAAASTGLRPADGDDHFEGTLGLTRELRPGVVLRLFARHSFAGKAIEAVSPDETWGGATLRVSF